MTTQKQGAMQAADSYLASLNDISEWNGMTLVECCASEVAVKWFKAELSMAHDAIPPLTTLYMLKRRFMSMYRIGNPRVNLYADYALNTLNAVERIMVE